MPGNRHERPQKDRTLSTLSDSSKAEAAAAALSVSLALTVCVCARARAHVAHQDILDPPVVVPGGQGCVAEERQQEPLQSLPRLMSTLRSAEATHSL